MADIEFISKSEFESIFNTLGKDLYTESNGIIQPSLQKIQAYCNDFIKMYDLYIIKSQSIIQKQNNSTTNFEQFITSATFILYEIRSSLLNEEIQFVIGTTSPNATRITAAIYDQREVLKNLKVDLKTMEVSVTNTISASAKQGFLNDASILTQWGQIIEWAKVPNWKQAQKLGKIIENRDSYQKEENDINILFNYSGGKRHQLNTYYQDKHHFFNRGWLFEWYLEYVDKILAIPDATINDEKFWPAPTSLSKMMWGHKMDRIKGYKGGDIVIQNQAYQAKMKNHRIIRVGDLYKAIKKLNNILTKYLSGELNQQATAQELAYLFTEYDAQSNVVEVVNKDFNDILNTVLNNLKQFARS